MFKSKSSLFIILFVMSSLTFMYAQAEEGFRFAVIGDRTGGAQPGIYESVLAEVNLMDPDIILTVGDHIEGYNQDSIETNKQWDKYFGLLQDMKAKFYFTPGNHDMWDKISEINYKNRVAQPYYSFDFKNTHFIILDVSRSEKYEEMAKEQINWLLSDLEKNKNKDNIYVFFHKPFWFEAERDNKPDSLHLIFKKYGVDAVFNGHYHGYFATQKDGILYTDMSSSGGTMSTENMELGYHYQFLWCTVNGSKLDVAVVNLGNIFDRNYVTVEDKIILDGIEGGKYISFSPVKVDEKTPDFSGEEKLIVYNGNANAFSDTVRWKCEDNWSIEPIAQSIVVDPSKTAESSFKVNLKGSIYPLPRFELKYPVGEKKMYLVDDRLWIKREMVCGKMIHPPTLDGNVSKSEWKDITPVTSFCSPTGDKTVVEPTRFYFGYDNSNLYMAVKCTESKRDQIVSSAKTQDGAVYQEDCVGYFICPDTAAKDIYQIYFNSLGTPFDQLIKYDGGNYNADRKWNGKYQVKSTMAEDGWSIEIKISFSQLKAKPKKGDVWDINFRRKQKRLNSSSDWMYPITYDIKYYGMMKFD